MNGTPSIFADIPFHPDVSELSRSAWVRDDALSVQAQALWDSALRLARPKAVVLQADVLHDDGGKVISIGGQPVDSALLDRNLSRRHRAFAYVATCGTELASLTPEGGEDVGPLLFTLQMLALRTAIEFATEQVKARCGISKLAQMNPGSLPEWPISGQTKLFAMLCGAAGEIGVTLGERMFMSPSVSASGLMFETENDYKNCMICTRLDCVGRQAPYDAELAAKYR